MVGTSNALNAAIFAGDRADFTLSGFAIFNRIVQANTGSEGRDTLSFVELLQFDDGVLDDRTGTFTPGGYATPAVEALVTTPGFTTNPGPFQPFTPSVSQPQVESLVVVGEVA